MTLRTLLGALVLLASPLVVLAGTAPAQAAGGHTLAVSGTGVGMFPAFDPATERYAVTTTGGTAGAVTVSATTTDPRGVVRVNGRTVSGPVTVTGLAEGDEISVLFEDSDSTSVHSLVYLPAGFPHLEVVEKKAGIAPGLVALTPTTWGAGLASFEAYVDRNGVPAFVRTATGIPMDLKKVAKDRYVVGRRGPDRYVLLDERFREITSYRTVGLGHTDLHDIALRDNGNVVLLAYVSDTGTGLTDAVVQELRPDGTVAFEWSSAPYEADSTYAGNDGRDYAHVNSVQVMRDGDLLLSFRHFSAVWKIARRAHDGHRKGDVVWKLGGRDSDFTFVDDPYPGGPCAQHTGYELADGNILVYDNGGGAICVDPDDRPGAVGSRPQTRASEYRLDEAAGTATLVWSWEPEGRFGLFGGSAQRLDNGNTLTGWSAGPWSIATEVDDAGETVWEIRDRDAADSSTYYTTYRAAKARVPDALRPQVRIASPAKGAVYAPGASVRADLACTDRGGSSLVACRSSQEPGEDLDTDTLGAHVLEVTARDGAGNTRTVRRTYRVAPADLPDARVRKGGGAWRGDDVYGGPSAQRVTAALRRGATVRATVRVQNDGTTADRLVVSGPGSGRGFSVRYRQGGDDVTGQVAAGALRSPQLRPGETWDVEVRVTRTKEAATGARRTLALRATSTDAPSRRDTAGLRVKAVR